MKLTQRQQIVAKGTEPVFLLHGEDDKGREIYCFLAVPVARLDQCLDAMDRDGFTPAEWGNVVAHGIGIASDFHIRSVKRQLGLEGSLG